MTMGSGQLQDLNSWQLILDQIDTFIALVDEEGTILLANQHNGVICNSPERECHEALHGTATPPLDCLLVQAQRAGFAEREFFNTQNNRWSREKVFRVQVNGKPLFLHLVEDVTETSGVETSLWKDEGAQAVSDRSTGGTAASMDVTTVPGKGRILLMDDQEFILEITGEVLRTLGYEVELARDGSEAIQLYKSAMEKGDPFDLAIMDLVIPGGMGGKEAVMTLKEYDPGIKAIVSSGYGGDASMAELEKFGFSGVLTKPYKIEDLAHILSIMLGNDRPRDQRAVAKGSSTTNLDPLV